MNDKFKQDLDTLTRLASQVQMAISMVESDDLRELSPEEQRLPQDHFIIGDFVIRPRTATDG